MVNDPRMTAAYPDPDGDTPSGAQAGPSGSEPPASRRAAKKATEEPVVSSLYEKRQKIYPREVHGKFAFLRALAATVLLGLFYGVAWLQWDGRQALLFDLPERKFHVFWWTFWPQDFFLMTGMMIAGALSLFLFTNLAGRLWCGYACPQTVWTEIFLWMERKIEGDRGAQMKLAKAPWSARKLRIKSTKHAVWITFALFTGFTFVGYFTPIRELTGKIAAGGLGGWETFWILFYGFATYGNAGWMREQVCKYMCPYARFQSAMFDRNTLIISYDAARGEPRGSRRRGVKESTLGDCVDCTMCVQVCPTGIDIRDGLQYECIGCSACIDVCNDVMGKMGYEPGLIRYTTENALEGKPSKVLRPRTLLYFFLLFCVIGAVGYGIMTRTLVGLDVIRDRNSLYREVGAGTIENVYTLKILNKTEREQTYDLTVSGIPGATLDIDQRQPTVAPGGVLSIPARIRVEEDALSGRSSTLALTVTSVDDPTLTYTTRARFLGP